MANSGAGAPEKEVAVPVQQTEAPAVDVDDVEARMEVPASNVEMAAPEDEKEQIQKEPVAESSNMPAETEVQAKPDDDAANDA